MMNTIELFPTLEHCIEKTAKQQFDFLAGRYMELGKKDAATEERIELLRTFLATADFRTLRQQSEVLLAAGKKVKFVLCFQGTAIEHRMEVLPEG